MAFGNSIDTLRDKIKTSIHGRRLGMDNDESLVGFKNIKRPVNAATSDTTGTNLVNFGINTVVSTTNDSWTLTAPYTGANVTLMTGSSSTGIHTVKMASGSVIYSSNGIAGANAILTGAGAAISLVGLSTSVWGVVSIAGSSDSNYVSS